MINKIKIYIFVLFAVICICYFIAITIFIGYFNIYNFIWVFIGSAFIIFNIFKNRVLKYKIIKTAFLIAASVFSLSFIIVEIFIINSAKTDRAENADYIIILGAGLNGKSPSLTLIHRINTAVDYLKSNRDAKIIVSGGKGSNENITEAEAMSSALQSAGINAERVILEDRSINTFENLKYSAEIINDYNKKILIVSSEFHLFRAKAIAKKIGYKNIGALAGRSPGILLPNYYVREYFAVIKEIILKNI